MKALSSLLFVLMSISSCYGQSDFIVSEANTLGGLYFYSDSLYVVSASDRAHVKSVLDQDSDYATYNLALLGPGYYNYRDICRVGDFLFVTKHGSPNNGLPGIYRLDLRDENAFFQLFINLDGAYGLASRSQELYVNAGNSIYKIDLSLTDPSLELIRSNVFEYTFGLGTLAMKVLNNDLYIVDDNGISKINLDDESYTYEYISTYNGWGIALKDENTVFLTFSDDLNEFGAIYELKIDTQEYTKLFTIDGFLQSYDIEYHNNGLFVTTLSGDNNKVVYLDLNNLSIREESVSGQTVYPNPTSDSISISGLKQREEYVIYNVTGQKVKQGSIFRDSLDVTRLTPGMYFLQFKTGTVLKFIKH